MNLNSRTVGVVGGTVLLVVAVAAILAMAASGGVSANETDGLSLYEYNDDDDRYVAVQGDRCIPIEPLGDGHRTAEEYYDYRNPNTSPPAYDYSSHGTTHLQEDDTSLLFLHEGSDGLSIVFVHDRLEGDTEGGAATLVFTGLPAEGEWVVEDDNYDGADSEWDHRDTSSRITSVWTEGRTDGGAFNGGLDGEFAVEVTPAFNEMADFRLYDGEVTEWQLLSGTDHDPERTTLDMTEPVQLRTGGCAMVSDVSVNETATVGESVDVEATITNAGEREETVTVPIAIDGEVVAEEDVTIAANSTEALSTTVSLENEGEQSLSVGGVSAPIDVEGDDSDELPGFGVAVALVAILAALAVARLRG
ncbi:PGF-CTERM sorting domain-containing protein [Halovivax gelatinilyticus]|uniref:PGF-CTERM sorting domain-containing protein n=1 Tax=Halovivax gelatinilyticus TaxID=2961597 RepID=UPI0020CA858F|nr:PGF-CTERM sorting domain-containing protein [Halovivax gelatinilyticus]